MTERSEYDYYYREPNISSPMAYSHSQRTPLLLEVKSGFDFFVPGVRCLHKRNSALSEPAPPIPEVSATQKSAVRASIYSVRWLLLKTKS